MTPRRCGDSSRHRSTGFQGALGKAGWYGPRGAAGMAAGRGHLRGADDYGTATYPGGLTCIGSWFCSSPSLGCSAPRWRRSPPRTRGSDRKALQPYHHQHARLPGARDRGRSGRRRRAVDRRRGVLPRRLLGRRAVRRVPRLHAASGRVEQGGSSTELALAAGRDDLAQEGWVYAGGSNTFDLGVPAKFLIYLTAASTRSPPPTTCLTRGPRRS